jgi:membrane-associated phospholipid phosphatase
MHVYALQPLLDADQAMVQVAAEFRWAPLTVLFVVVSAWWVKGPLYVIAGLARDLKERCLPVTALGVTLSVLLASAASTLLKDAFDRSRPPVADPSFEAAVSVPTSPSFPSGHATTAFAAAAALALMVPSLRRVAFLLAAAVALSRVYLGVHYVADVVAGAALGTAVGLAVCLLLRAEVRDRTRRARVREPTG